MALRELTNKNFKLSVENTKQTSRTIEVSEQKSGQLIGINDGKKFQLAVYIGNDKILILYVHGDGIKATNFTNLENHIKSGFSLNRISVPELRNLSEFESNCQFYIYSVNILDMRPMLPNQYLELLRNNLKEISNFEKGDIIAFTRSFVGGLSYTHAAIFSDSLSFKVIHRNGEPDPDATYSQIASTLQGAILNKAIVVEEHLFDIMETSPIYKYNHLDSDHPPRPKDEIIRYARSRLGDVGYHIALNNCQHFATKCRNDVEVSFEVKKAVNYTLLSLAVAGAGALMAYMFRSSTTNQEEDENRADF